MTALTSGVVAATAPVTRRVRAYFGPVDRAVGAATAFDAVGSGRFDLESPPPGWVDLGWCTGFARRCGTRVEALRSGAPGVAQDQVRSEIEATVALEFESWGKLQLALAAGMQQMNLLRVGAGAGPGAIVAVAVGAGSTATVLQPGVAAAQFAVGDVIAVDVDYAGQVGFVGSGVSGAYVGSAVSIGADTHYVRRITCNVQRVVAVGGGGLTLAGPLIAGAPGAGMKVSAVAGFCDREGSTFFQEWSGLFVMAGEQGDRVIFYYPRLQSMAGAAESVSALAAGLERVRLAGHFRALAVKDANDGEMVVCYRSYLPAAMRAV